MCSHKSVPERRVSRHSRITHVLGFVAHAAIFGRFREALPENCFFLYTCLEQIGRKKSHIGKFRNSREFFGCDLAGDSTLPDEIKHRNSWLGGWRYGICIYLNHWV
jgi:hypothetical protein